MWILERKRDGKAIHLLCNKEYTVGRQRCNITLPEDGSVSRRHLILKVDVVAGVIYTSKPPLKIKDLGSTFGTYINPTIENNGKIQANEWVDILRPSVIHFGANNEWIARWVDIITLHSAIRPSGRTRLHSVLNRLGAKQLTEWSDNVDYLVMEKIVFTQKVMRILVAAKPIVTVEYFEAWVEALDEDPFQTNPDISLYTPPIDSSLNHFQKHSFLPKIDRRTLFHSHVFVFPSKEQYDSMAPTVESGGGKALYQKYDEKDIILIECSDEKPSKEYLTMYDVLTSQGKRVVPMKEIGLALLDCSTKRYCNPLLNLQQTLFRNLNQTPVIPSQLSILAPDTQSIPHVAPVAVSECGKGEPLSKRIKIEPSEEILVDEIHPSKRPRIEENDISPKRKKKTCELTTKPAAKVSVYLSYSSLVKPLNPATGAQCDEKQLSGDKNNVDMPKRSVVLKTRTNNSRASKKDETNIEFINTTRTLSDSFNKMCLKLPLVRTDSKNNLSFRKQNQLQEKSRQYYTSALEKSSKCNDRIKQFRIARFHDGKWTVTS